MTVSTKLKLIDLGTIATIVVFAYYFREALLIENIGWQLTSLTVLGFALGLTYHFQGDALCTSERTQLVFVLTYAAMIFPAIASADGWTIIFAWLMYGAMGVPIAIPMYFGWGVPMFFGRKAPTS
jgi:hypothetical protein